MTQHIHKMLKYEIFHLFITNEPKKIHDNNVFFI